MKTVLMSVAAIFVLLSVKPAQASSTPINPSEKLFAVLEKSGLNAQVPFAGASTVEAYDVSCVITAEESKRSVTCDLANKPSAAHPNQIHLKGPSAARLYTLLHSASALDGDSGAASAFIRCSRYAYEGVDTTFECQVAVPFGAR